MKIRFFAAAAEAAGTEGMWLDAETLTAAEVVARLGEGNQRLAQVLEVSSLLADGARVEELNTVLVGVSQLDVLPPFAGG